MKAEKLYPYFWNIYIISEPWCEFGESIIFEGFNPRFMECACSMFFFQANSIACSTNGSALPQIHVNENGKGLFFNPLFAVWFMFMHTWEFANI